MFARIEGMALREAETPCVRGWGGSVNDPGRCREVKIWGLGTKVRKVETGTVFIGFIGSMLRRHVESRGQVRWPCSNPAATARLSTGRDTRSGDCPAHLERGSGPAIPGLELKNGGHRWYR